MERPAFEYPRGVWSDQPVTARTLYRRFRRAARLDAKGELVSTELAHQMLIQAWSDALGSGLPIGRIYFAATHSS